MYISVAKCKVHIRVNQEYYINMYIREKEKLPSNDDYIMTSFLQASELVILTFFRVDDEGNIYKVSALCIITPIYFQFLKIV